MNKKPELSRGAGGELQLGSYAVTVSAERLRQEDCSVKGQSEMHSKPMSKNVFTTHALDL